MGHEGCLYRSSSSLNVPVFCLLGQMFWGLVWLHRYFRLVLKIVKKVQRVTGGRVCPLLPQEFFSLAWSSVLMSGGDQGSARLCSILAAGGKRGVVKLIHPRNNLAYGEFRASRKSLSVLRFHEQQGNVLFSKSPLGAGPSCFDFHACVCGQPGCR